MKFFYYVFYQFVGVVLEILVGKYGYFQVEEEVKEGQQFDCLFSSGRLGVGDRSDDDVQFLGVYGGMDGFFGFGGLVV